MIAYERNSNAILTATFVTATGAAATISGTPTISIYHVKNDSITTDVNAQNMTQLSGSTYYYDFYISSNADKCDYITKVSATYADSTIAIGEITFRVVDKDFYKHKGAGSIIQKTTAIDIWTEKEKNAIITEINNINKKITELIENNKEIIGVSKEWFAITSKIQDAISKLKSQISEIKFNDNDKYNNKFTDIAIQINNLQKDLTAIEKQLIKPNKEILNNMNELKSNIDEMSGLIIKIMPSDKLEEALNESQKIGK